MLTIAICDDNPIFARSLAKKIHQLCAYKLPERIDCQIAPIFNSAEQVITFLKRQSINILFLDIDMPTINGFKLAEILCENYPDTIIIFVSSYEDFVYSSFEYYPFRFLRKNHLEQELPITFQKVIEKCIFDNELLTFNTTLGEQILRVKDIVFFEGQKNYYNIYTTSNKSYKCRGTMESVEQLVSTYDFFRVHAAFIVNEDLIDNFDNSGYVTMKNGTQISISKRRLTAFRESYMKFIRKKFSK